MNTPTPRTDANDLGWQFNEQYGDFDSLSDTPMHWLDFSKMLERELTAALEELAELKEEYGTWLAQKRIAIDDLVELNEQRDRARREAEQWRDCFKIGMSMQVKSPSQIFPWEKKSTEP